MLIPRHAGRWRCEDARARLSRLNEECQRCTTEHGVGLDVDVACGHGALQERVAHVGGRAEGLDHARLRALESRGEVAIAEADDVEFGRVHSAG